MSRKVQVDQRKVGDLNSQSQIHSVSLSLFKKVAHLIMNGGSSVELGNFA